MTDPWVLPQASAPAARAGEPGAPAFPTAAADGSERFPIGSEAGWRADPTVPGQLRLWDGKHWTDHVRSLELESDQARPLGSIRTNTSLRAWALMAQLTLGLWIAVSCIAMLWQIATLNTLEVWSLQPGDLHEGEARDLLRQTILIVVAQLLVHVVSVAFLLVWIGVARNDRYINKALLRGSTGGAVIGWLIIFLRVKISHRRSPTCGTRPTRLGRATGHVPSHEPPRRSSWPTGCCASSPRGSSWSCCSAPVTPSAPWTGSGTRSSASSSAPGSSSPRPCVSSSSSPGSPTSFGGGQPAPIHGPPRPSPRPSRGPERGRPLRGGAGPA